MVSTRSLVMIGSLAAASGAFVQAPASAQLQQAQRQQQQQQPMRVAAVSMAEPLLKLRGGNALADVSVGTVNLVNAIYYGGYGVPLLIDGDKFFGPSGMMPYQNKDIEGPVGKFFSKVRKRDSNSRLPVSLPLSSLVL